MSSNVNLSVSFVIAIAFGPCTFSVLFVGVVLVFKIFDISSTVIYGTGSGLVSRFSTISEAQSISSNMIIFLEKSIEFLSLSELYVLSKKKLSNCCRVFIFLNDNTTRCLSGNLFASALISEVLPVPGGPCRPMPRL